MTCHKRYCVVHFLKQHFAYLIQHNTFMGYCRKDITPVLTHWSYAFLALTHRYITLQPLDKLGYTNHTATTLPFNTLRPRQNGGHFPDDIKWIFLNENIWISIKISLKFVPRGPINNIPALVQIMAWRRQGDKPLSEPMMVRLLTALTTIDKMYKLSVSLSKWPNISVNIYCHLNEFKEHL